MGRIRTYCPHLNRVSLYLISFQSVLRRAEYSKPTPCGAKRLAAVPCHLTSLLSMLRKTEDSNPIRCRTTSFQDWACPDDSFIFHVVGSGGLEPLPAKAQFYRLLVRTPHFRYQYKRKNPLLLQRVLVYRYVESLIQVFFTYRKYTPSASTVITAKRAIRIPKGCFLCFHGYKDTKTFLIFQVCHSHFKNMGITSHILGLPNKQCLVLFL